MVLSVGNCSIKLISAEVLVETASSPHVIATRSESCFNTIFAISFNLLDISATSSKFANPLIKLA